MEETLKLLLNEVNDGIETLSNTDAGSDAYGAITTDVCKLLEKATAMKKQIDDSELKREEMELKEKARIEEAEKSERIRTEELEYKEKVRKEEIEIRKQERCEDKTEREINKADEKESERKEFMIECAKIAVPVLTTAALVLHDDRISKILLKFEETGSLSTSWARSFFGKVMKRGK